MNLKLLPPILVVAILVTISGCISLSGEFSQFCREEYDVYIQDSYLGDLHFFRPPNTNRNGLRMQIDVYKPDNSLHASYQQQFYYPVQDVMIFETDYDIKLIHVGFWHIDFSMHEGESVFDHTLVEGSFNILVKDNSDIVYLYELEDFIIPESPLENEDVTISFSIKNTGAIDYRLPICLWDSTMVYDRESNKYTYGTEWYRTTGEGIRIESGDSYSNTFNIPNIDRKYSISLQYDEDITKENINTVGIINTIEIGDEGDGTFRGLAYDQWAVIIIVLGIVGAFLLMRRR